MRARHRSHLPQTHRQPNWLPSDWIYFCETRPNRHQWGRDVIAAPACVRVCDRSRGAIGAVVARFVHTEEVTGSNPVSPTRIHVGPRPVSRSGTGLVPSPWQTPAGVRPSMRGISDDQHTHRSADQAVPSWARSPPAEAGTPTTRTTEEDKVDEGFSSDDGLTPIHLLGDAVQVAREQTGRRRCVASRTRGLRMRACAPGPVARATSTARSASACEPGRCHAPPVRVLAEILESASDRCQQMADGGCFVGPVGITLPAEARAGEA